MIARIQKHVQNGLSQNITSQEKPSQDERPSRRIEVHITQGPGGTRQVLLQDLSHGPGIGWYVQKTIRLDREQVDALLRSLCCARHGGAMPCPEAGLPRPESGKGKGRGATEARIVSIDRLLRS